MKISKFQSRFQLHPSLKNQVPIENFKVLEELHNDCERDINEHLEVSGIKIKTKNSNIEQPNVDEPKKFNFVFVEKERRNRTKGESKSVYVGLTYSLGNFVVLFYMEVNLLFYLLRMESVIFLKDIAKLKKTIKL